MTNPVSVPPVDVAAIRKLLDETTPGPWLRSYRDNGDIEIESDGGRRIAFCGKRDSEFIAAARQLMPILLDALVSAESRAQEAENALSRVDEAITDAVTVARAGVVVRGLIPDGIEGVTKDEALDIYAEAVLEIEAAVVTLRGDAT